ncbi:hypothetical protein KIW84_063811 [Lathyrus oleraceus]|uniref:Uncharacterized protein n=1 Tax=Pisum sativum TaxID=3888 RepID=A0A9D4W9W7_PEA|nr:hypothetical protein KIW84_063811 [Pisum sativum]
MMGQPNQTIPTEYVMNEVGSTATTEVVGAELVNTQPTKKRKASASGSRQSSACWEHFIRLPDDLEQFGAKTFLIYVELVFSKTGETIGVNYMGMEITDQVRKREKMAKLREEIAVQKAKETELNKTIHITDGVVSVMSSFCKQLS